MIKIYKNQILAISTSILLTACQLDKQSTQVAPVAQSTQSTQSTQSAPPSTIQPIIPQSPIEIPKDDSKVLAKVGDVVITEKEFERRLNLLTPFTKARYQSPERKREFLDSLIRFELLAKEAQNRGHHLNPDVQLNYKQAMVKELMRKEVRNLVKLSDIQEAEVQAYYQEHLDEYQRPLQIRGAHILIQDQVKAQAILDELLALQKEQTKENEKLKDPLVLKKAFGDWALKESLDEESKGKRGDLQYLVKVGTQPKSRLAQSIPTQAILDALFSLKEVGEIYPSLIKSEKGYHLIQKTGERPAFSRSLENVSQEIKNQLLRQKKNKAMESYVDQMKKQVEINIDEKALSEMKINLYVTPPSSSDQLMDPSQLLEDDEQKYLEGLGQTLRNALNPSNQPANGHVGHGHPPINP
jgi:peptidyl-prolyl cis-trans isomerase C